MKRALGVFVFSLPMLLGLPAVAQADDSGSGWFPGGGLGPVAAVAGTVVSTDSQNGTFVANAYVVAPPWLTSGSGGDGQGSGSDDQGSDQSWGDVQFGRLIPHDVPQGLGGLLQGLGLGSLFGDGSGSAPVFTPPTPTQVTISTDSNTVMIVNGQEGSVSNLSAGDKFVALFTGSPSDGINSLVANPAVAVFDKTPPKPHQLYAFVGSVTGVDPSAGTVTVNVTNSLPSGLVPSGSPPVQFTVSADTLVLGGSNGNGLGGGSLSSVSPGDVVAGGVVAPAGETLSQIETTPLKLLLDFPVASGSSSSPSALAHARAKALHEAVALLGGSKSGKGSKNGSKNGKGHHKHKGHKKHKKSHSHKS